MTTILIIGLCVVGTFGYMVLVRKGLDRRYAHMRAGEVAQRLGMRVVEGDAQHNLATMPIRPDQRNIDSAKGFLRQVKATQLGGSLGEFTLKAAGEPYGARAELVLYCRQTFEPGYASSTTTTWYDLRLTVHARRQVVPFDLRKRAETMHLETRRDDGEQRMPAQRFGDPGLDGTFVIESPDPTLPRYIGAALGPLADLPYVHVTGGGEAISFVMTPASVMATAMSLESILHVLASIAALLEGRPMPSRAAMAPAGTASIAT